jgi:hypothetical protein
MHDRDPRKVFLVCPTHRSGYPISIEPRSSSFSKKMVRHKSAPPPLVLHTPRISTTPGMPTPMPIVDPKPTEPDHHPVLIQHLPYKCRRFDSLR